MKKILIPLIHSMIAFTIIHAPIVLQYPVSYGVAFAQEVDSTTEEFTDSTSGSDPSIDDIPDSGETTGENTSTDCDEGDNVPEGQYLYKPGCAFQNEASLVEKLDAKNWELIVNMLLALVLLQAVLYTPTPRSPIDCKQNIGPTSIRVAQIATLSYIISEFANNAFYRNASKAATDIAFDSTKEDYVVQSNKQMRAFDALIELYEGQENVTISKITFSALLEAAYLSSEGIEIGNIIACNSTCTTMRTAATAAFEAAKYTIIGASTTFSGAVPLFTPGCAIESAAACGVGYLASLAALSAYYQGLQVTTEGLAVKEFSYDSAKFAAEYATMPSTFTSLLTPLAPVASIGSKLTFGLTKTAAQHAEDLRKFATNSAAISLQVSNELGLISANTTALSACGTALATDRKQSVASLGSCEAQLAPASAAVIAASSAITTGIPAVEAALKMPVECCGTEGSGEGTPTLRIGVPLPPGTFAINHDIEILDLIGSNDSPTSLKRYIQRVVEVQNPKVNELVDLFAKKHSAFELEDLVTRQFKKEVNPYDEYFEKLTQLPAAKKVMSQIEQGNFKEIIEKFVYNLFFDQILENVKKRNIKDPVYEMNLIAYHVNKLNQKMHSNRMLMALNTNDLLDASKKLAKNDSSNSMMNSLFEAVIANAHASEEGGGLSDGPWMELIAVGATGILALFGVLGSFVKNNLSVPKKRAFVWGAFMLVAAGVITANSLTLGDVRERIRIVKKERKKFLNAVPGEAGVSPGGADPRKGTTYDTQSYSKQAVMGQSATKCASLGSDGSFMPASCPSKVAPGSFNVAKGLGRISGNLDPSHLQGLGTLAATTQEVATTGTNSPSTLSGGNLEGLKQNNAAMRKANEKLRQKADAMRKKVKGKVKLSPSLGEINRQVLAAYKGGAVNAQTAQAADALAKDISESMKEDLRKEGKGEGQITTGAVPKIDVATPNFDFNMGDDQMPGANDDLGLSGLGKEKNLKDFVLNHNDINRKKEVSIFKILSNRYILSYPKIIPEKKSKTPEASKVQEKVEPSKPLTLEDKLDGAR